MEWRPEEDGCRYRIGATYETARWQKPMVPLVAASFLRQNLDDLVRLKRLLEDGGSRPAQPPVETLTATTGPSHGSTWSCSKW
jgi:hypothetical protein